jgi:hypothetical protein
LSILVPRMPLTSSLAGCLQSCCIHWKNDRWLITHETVVSHNSPLVMLGLVVEYNYKAKANDQSYKLVGRSSSSYTVLVLLIPVHCDIGGD